MSDRGVVPLSGGVREKLQAKLEDPLGLGKAPDMFVKLVGSTATFHLRNGQTIKGKLVGASKFELFIIDADSKRLVVPKHSIDYAELGV